MISDENVCYLGYSPEYLTKKCLIFKWLASYLKTEIQIVHKIEIEIVYFYSHHMKLTGLDF